MSLLSGAELNSMRDTLDQSLPDTAIIQVPVHSSDAGGGGTTTWTASGTVACRLSPMTGDERETASRIAPYSDWVITLPAETAITEEARIVIASTTFNVTAIRAPRSWEISRRVEASEES